MKPEEIIDALRDPDRRKDPYVTYEAANCIESLMEQVNGLYESERAGLDEHDAPR